MLGLIVDMVRDMMETMKRRRTTVVEEGHILVLGWTDKTLQLVQDHVIADPVSSAPPQRTAV